VALIQASEDPLIAVVVTFVPLLAGVAIAIRGWNLSVEIKGPQLVVHGYLRDRTIPKRAVLEVTSGATVKWRDAKGRTRWTPIWAFNSPPGEPRATSVHKAQCRHRIARWAGVRPPRELGN
jgi:hypothetical protein